MRTLVALDFDWTLIDEDSDQAVITLLPPNVHADLREKPYASMQWTDKMNHIYGELHRSGCTREQITTVFTALKLHSSMRTALQLAKQTGAADVVIISDSNTVAIQECLRAHQLDSVVSEVITNESTWTPEGRLGVRRYVSAETPHGCTRTALYKENPIPSCALNICKGRELRRLRAGYDRVVYLGDGRNDYCPGCELTSLDVYMPRRDRGLHAILSGPDGAAIQARTVYWTHADDVLEEFETIFAPLAANKSQAP
ncbi:phosphatase phospho-type [Thamnocephalis sphaerospora]|uniref:Phosphatase phospho-type n=1 Tax=Thamnocephalis sphaerospora TaxID=78915 RepID=A0A4P9XKG5_9FUNG|nr:phosphatase phospho-type [Thamnocephalis sphaerospora]|eukprot:RKP06293.1 phosphatase phospho-type [Thamnocephalis sphaerospora]